MILIVNRIGMNILYLFYTVSSVESVGKCLKIHYLVYPNYFRYFAKVLGSVSLLWKNVSSSSSLSQMMSLPASFLMHAPTPRFMLYILACALLS